MSYWEKDWDRCEGWLQAALDESPIMTHTLTEVRAGLEDGSAQLWPAHDAAAVTEILVYPTGLRTLNYWLGGGNLDTILAGFPVLEAFARHKGCDAIEAKGRRGWAPVCRKLGFGPPCGTFFVKRLTDG
jgi:hypothetical protein